MAVKQPLLFFPDTKGQYHSEYIPPRTAEEPTWFYDLCNRLRQRFNRDVYYWHMDHALDAEDRKRLDMHFIQHVETQHDGKPEDKREASHYSLLRTKYGQEYDWVQRVLAGQRTDEEMVHRGSSYYAIIYQHRWLTATPETNWSMLYHGVAYGDALNLMLAELQNIQTSLQSLGEQIDSE